MPSGTEFIIEATDYLGSGIAWWRSQQYHIIPSSRETVSPWRQQCSLIMPLAMRAAGSRTYPSPLQQPVAQSYATHLCGTGGIAPRQHTTGHVSLPQLFLDWVRWGSNSGMSQDVLCYATASGFLSLQPVSNFSSSMSSHNLFKDFAALSGKGNELCELTMPLPWQPYL